MDRLTASSTAPPPDWPLPSLPFPSLINVSKESKRHCRLLPAGMVNLKLAQMADREAQKTLDRKKVEISQYEIETKKTQKKRRNGEPNKLKKKTKRNGISDLKLIRPSSFDEMIDSVDALLSSFTSPTEAIPPNPSKSPQSPPRTTVLPRTSPLPPCITTTAPLPTSPRIPKQARTSPRPTSPALPANSPRPHPHPLHSNPPSPTTLTHARNLTAHLTTTKATRKSKPLSFVKTPDNSALAVYDAATQYGVAGGKKGKRVAFARAVVKGLRGVLGRERGR